MTARTIATLEERWALPRGTVIRDAAGVAWVKRPVSWMATTPIEDDQWIGMPATVLHAPSVAPEAAVEALDALVEIAKVDITNADVSEMIDDLAKDVRAALPPAPSATRDEVARLIDPSGWRYFDTGMFPPDHPASTGIVHNSRETADALLARFTITPKEDR